MSKNLYDVYDLNDNLVIKAMTSDEIAKALDVSVRHVSKCEIECKKLKSKYKIVKSEQEYNSMNTVEKNYKGQMGGSKKTIFECRMGQRNGSRSQKIDCAEVMA